MQEEFVEKRSDVIKNFLTLYRSLISGNNKTDVLDLYNNGVWFAVEKIGNKLFFGPSRFVGYKNNSIEIHKNNKNKDGRQTNKILSKRLLYSKIQDNEFLINQFQKFISPFMQNEIEKTKFFVPNNIDLSDLNANSACYFISPTHCPKFKKKAWNSFLNNEIMAIGWKDEDYSNSTAEEIKNSYPEKSPAIQAFKNIKDIKYGDIICTTNNNHGLWGIGVALSSYRYKKNIHFAGEDEQNNRCFYSHYVDVAWLSYDATKNEYIKSSDLKITEPETIWPSLGTLFKSQTIPRCILNYLFKENIENVNDMNDLKKYIELLKNKQQIILQGAPGTGKTYTAKNIAEQLIFGKVSSDKNEQASNLRSHEQFKLIQFHSAYTYEDFVRGIEVKTENGQPQYITRDKLFIEMAKKASADPEKKYILIIDEINRANLPAVLGELIYALEYRGEQVESMYAVNDDNRLTIPPNLYIIGTMNTADRSVGHIDYAIRRRFAFIDILPTSLQADFKKDLFIDISELFIKSYEEYEKNKILNPSIYLSDEFRVEDVWLGQSYFIISGKDEKNITQTRLQYEIIPILKEYIKDGIFKDIDGIRTKIKEIETKYSNQP